jgi:hypothetical protein
LRTVKFFLLEFFPDFPSHLNGLFLWFQGLGTAAEILDLLFNFYALQHIYGNIGILLAMDLDFVFSLPRYKDILK